MDSKNSFNFIFFILFQITFAIDEKSFTVVLDTTASMRDEIDSLKRYMESALASINNTNIANYILVPYSDPDPGSITISPTYNDFMNTLNTISITGGTECPENSLKAIKKALEVSHSRSYIFVFTDAQARDYSSINLVQQLCLRRRSQIFTFISGKCLEDHLSPVAEKVFYDIAKSCYGSIFHIHETEFVKIFQFIREITNVDWTEVNTPDEFYNNAQFTFIIDKYTTNMAVAISGLSPVIQIQNTELAFVPITRKILDTKHSLVVGLDYLEQGNYTIDFSCQGSAVATFYRRKVIHFKYGFSPKRPKNIIETAARPIPDEPSNIFIELPEGIGAVIISVQLQFIEDNIETTIPFETLDSTETKYIATATFQPHKPFKILIICEDETTHAEIKTKSDILEAQARVNTPKATRPYMQLTELDKILVDFGTNYTMSCIVHASPKPDIWWETETGEILPSESALLELPLVYISYLLVENATTNRTYSCKAANTAGENSLDMEFLVNRTFTFDVIQYPTDVTVEYDNEGLLFCEANSFPESKIKWYHNDTVVEYSSDNIQLVPEDNKLVITRMGLDDTGEYKCEITNTIETRTYKATVHITGLEQPQVRITNSGVLYLNLGDAFEEICHIRKGKPLPLVTWKYKSKIDDDFGNLTNGANVKKNSLQITSINKEHEGIYGCEASNVVGTDVKEITVKVKYAPNINNNDDNLRVRVGDQVSLHCDVDAVPEAIVHWEMYRDDVMLPLDNRHVTDEKYTHRFVAASEDSGNYQCVAENSLGRAVRNVTLNVLIGPYIEPVATNIWKVRAGTTVTFQCNIKFANPLPSVEWEFTNHYYQKAVLRSGKSVRKLDLILPNVSKKDEGVYQCLATSEDRKDNIKITLIVL